MIELIGFMITVSLLCYVIVLNKRLTAAAACIDAYLNTFELQLDTIRMYQEANKTLQELVTSMMDERHREQVKDVYEVPREKLNGHDVVGVNFGPPL